MYFHPVEYYTAVKKKPTIATYLNMDESWTYYSEKEANHRRTYTG